MTTLADLNACSPDTFIGLVGPTFESSPWIAAAVAGRRPFATREALHAALCDVVRSASADAQLALIRAHPDLVGRAVLTAASAGEQAAAGLTTLTPDEVSRFDGYNTAYRARFGFPFVICARLNRKDAILRAFPERLAHGRDEEIATAIAEICQIAALRLQDLLP